ncbi:MAG: PDZ domain-containing protein [Pirellulaceae bacterium]
MRYALIVCIVFSMVGTSAELSAQNPLQEFQKKVDDAMPKGRFLKRLRDEFRGSDKDNEKAKQQKNAQSAADKTNNPAYNQLPNRSPASRNANLSPTPAIRPAASSAPSQTSRNESAYGPTANWRDTANASRSTGFQPTSVENRNAQKERSKPDERPVGFGLVMEVEGQSVVVKDVDRKGNAFNAGIRKGDVIAGIGGMAIQSIEEFDQITDFMKNGDQIEMSIARKGKQEKVNVTFGYFDEQNLMAQEHSNTESNAPTSAPTPNDFAPPLTPIVPDKDNLFSDNSGLHSVLEGEFGSSSKRSTPMTFNASDVQALQSLIAEQRQQIEALKQEIARLKKPQTKEETFDIPLGFCP